jgi:hypothetical protein
MKSKLLIPLVILGTFRAYSAPAPATSSSLFASPEAGYFYQVRGFRLTGLSQWLLEPGPETEPTSDSGREFSVSYKNPSFQTARFSVQSDTLKSDISLESYTKKWMRDYSSYGFDVLGAKTFQAGVAKGLVVDLYHKKKDTQLRQVIFVKSKTAVVLTCLDQAKSFNQSLASCNQMVRGFSWTVK